MLYFHRNYAPTVRIQKEALEKFGCQQVLWLYGPNHMVTEVGTMNMFMYWINEEGGWLYLTYYIKVILYILLSFN